MQFDQNAILNITANLTPTPCDILIPEMFLNDQHNLSSIANVIECAVSSRRSSIPCFLVY